MGRDLTTLEPLSRRRMPSCSRPGDPPTLDKPPSSGAGSAYPRQEKIPGALARQVRCGRDGETTVHNARCTSGRCSQLSSSAVCTCILDCSTRGQPARDGRWQRASGMNFEQLGTLSNRRGFGQIGKLPTVFQLPARTCQLPHQEHRPTDQFTLGRVVRRTTLSTVDRVPGERCAESARKTGPCRNRIRQEGAGSKV
jgi:hypothetical protein